LSKFTLYHTNAIDTAVLGGGSWQPNLPLSNLLSPRTTQRARSTSAALSSTQFTVKLAEPVIVQGIQIISTNLSGAGQYKISWYSDAGLTLLTGTTNFIPVGSSINWSNTANWYDWLDTEFWLGAVPVIDPDNQGLDIRHNFSGPVSVQYLKFEIDDTTNTDGFVELGYVFIGHPYVPSINVDTNPSFSRISLTSMVEAIGGGQYFNRRGSRKRLTIAWSVMPKEEVLVDIDQIVRIQDIDKPVYVDLDPENIGSGRTTAFLARINQLPESRLLNVFVSDDTAATIGFDFIQVL
jgi:hypothetical protein